MGKPLTPDLVLARAKTGNLSSVKKINLWGNDIEDVKLLREMPNVEVLSLSVNKINSLREFANCPKLQELYLRKNSIADLSEIRYLTNLPDLKILWLLENPCSEAQNYREYVIKVLPNLVKLDNEAITPEERSAAAKLNLNFGDHQIKDNNYEPDSQGFDNEEPPSNKYAPDYGQKRGYDDDNDDQFEPIKQKEEARTPVNISKEKQINNPKNYGRDYQAEKNVKYGTPSSNFKNENVICAIVTLLKDLDEKGLEFVRDDIDKKLSNLRIKNKE